MNRINPNRKLPLYTLHMVLLLFVFLPLIFAFTSSFRPMEDIYRYVSPLSWKTFIPEHFTLEAYQTIFVEHGFGKALLNSLLIALLTVAVGILFNGMAGYAFAKFTFPGKKLLFLLVLLSYMVPFELISINLYAMMIDLKWIDTYLALIVPCIPNGMIIFLFRQYFMSFPDYLIEAARIDGMGLFRTFFSIVLPNSKAVCISAGLVLFVNQWESFLWPILVTRSQDMYTVQIALSNFSTQYTQNWNQIFAGSLIAFLVPVANDHRGCGRLLSAEKRLSSGLPDSGTDSGEPCRRQLLPRHAHLPQLALHLFYPARLSDFDPDHRLLLCLATDQKASVQGESAESAVTAYGLQPSCGGHDRGQRFVSGPGTSATAPGPTRLGNAFCPEPWS
ncbi:carbohydrate ABC transporter permease [Intestinimonas butyriciproducens]|uniref:carbohydrate ABC transporter permease n=1 Tax=Intestinimonas butyriciproducens TaxID=1297617 RepID=UPI00117BCDD3|nr:carbohydrate ABC transporter permease [Intestinimonas butyriciproducens]MDB7860482.1 carbohydrate ABC transporter permease [Intestinimonas butyriciproducens]MDB7863806.1 carbohydrate ABC transporter permease [Intestinimonas butyriciproducens]